MNAVTSECLCTDAHVRAHANAHRRRERTGSGCVVCFPQFSLSFGFFSILVAFILGALLVLPHSLDSPLGAELLIFSLVTGSRCSHPCSVYIWRAGVMPYSSGLTC